MTVEDRLNTGYTDLMRLREDVADLDGSDPEALRQFALRTHAVALEWHYLHLVIGKPWTLSMFQMVNELHHLTIRQIAHLATHRRGRSMQTILRNWTVPAGVAVAVALVIMIAGGASAQTTIELDQPIVNLSDQHYDDDVEEPSLSVIPMCSGQGDAFLDVAANVPYVLYVDDWEHDSLLIERDRLPVTIEFTGTSRDRPNLAGPFILELSNLGEWCTDDSVPDGETPVDAPTPDRGPTADDPIPDGDATSMDEPDLEPAATRPTGDVPQPTRIDSGTGGQRSSPPAWLYVMAAIGLAATGAGLASTVKADDR